MRTCLRGLGWRLSREKMALGFNDRALQRDASRVLASLRLSFERVLVKRGHVRTATMPYKEALYYLDDLRFEFHSLDLKGDKITEKQFLELVSKLQDGLASFLRVPSFRRACSEVPFSFLAARSTESFRLSNRFLSPISVLEAVDLLLYSLSARSGIEADVSQPDLIDLYIPDQSSAPLVFEIIEDTLTPVMSSEPPSAPDQAGTEAARKNLIESGFKLLDELSGSNYDKRIHDSVETVASKLLGSANIVDVGLSFSQVSVLTSALQEELPAALTGSLDSFFLNGRMYLHQFPDWNRFVENFNQADFTDASMQTVEVAAEETIKALEQAPEIATDQVPATIRFLTRLAASPAKEGKRASYALFRSLENLVIVVFQYLKELTAGSFNTAKDEITSFGGKVVAKALVIAALGTAIALSPVATSLPDGGWLTRAINTVQRQVEDWMKTP